MPKDSKPLKATVDRDASDSEKQSALRVALASIEKQYGRGSIMRLGELQNRLSIDVISTGCLAIDMALGVGGVPRGRIIEIFGPESSGKTTVALHIIAEAQKGGGLAAFIDAEHALDPIYASAIGVDTENLFIPQPDSGEQALEITEALVRSGALDIIVVDSVAALVPRAELDGDMGDSFVGVHARLMSQAMRKLAGAISRSHCAVVFINQIREKIGNSYGPTETTTGGRALKFYASVRMDVRRIDYVKQGSELIGSRTRVKIAKNKVAPPFRQAEFDLMYGTGISNESSVLDLAVDFNVVNKSGAWYSYNGDRLGQGRENVRLFLRDHPALLSELEEKIRAAFDEGKAVLPLSPARGSAAAADEDAPDLDAADSADAMKREF